MFFITTCSTLQVCITSMSQFFFKVKIFCHLHTKILDIFLRFSSEKFCFSKKLITDTKVLFRFCGGQNLDLLITREESDVSTLGFSEKNSAGLSFLKKSLMSFFFSVKLRYVVEVSFKVLLRIWIFKGVKLMLDKFGTLGSIISSSFGYLSLYIRNEEQKWSLTKLLTFSSTCFETSCLSGTVTICLFWWSLLLVSLLP